MSFREKLSENTLRRISERILGMTSESSAEILGRILGRVLWELLVEISGSIWQKVVEVFFFWENRRCSFCENLWRNSRMTFWGSPFRRILVKMSEDFFEEISWGFIAEIYEEFIGLLGGILTIFKKTFTEILIENLEMFRKSKRSFVKERNLRMNPWGKKYVLTALA